MARVELINNGGYNSLRHLNFPLVVEGEVWNDLDVVIISGQEFLNIDRGEGSRGVDPDGDYLFTLDKEARLIKTPPLCVDFTEEELEFIASTLRSLSKITGTQSQRLLSKLERGGY